MNEWRAHHKSKRVDRFCLPVARLFAAIDLKHFILLALILSIPLVCNFTTLAATQPDYSDLKKGDLYALVIGVSNYNKNELQLKVSDQDARDFANFLNTQEAVFRKSYVTLLVNERATKLAIEKQLHYDLLKAGKDDTVIIFLSGHGAGDIKKPGEYFFLGYDADPDYLEATAVKMSGLDFLRGIDARRVLVIADACHAGAFSKVRIKSLERELAGFTRQFTESSGRMILTSSKPDQYSQEGEKNSIFTHYLLKGLKGEADSDRNNVVTLKELYDYVYDQTKIETGGAQHPQLEGSQVGSFPVSFRNALDKPIALEALFVAQDPRCRNKDCTDPPDDNIICNDPMCRDVELKDGDTMYSGQNYQLAVRPSSTCHLYIYHVGPKGDLYRLFPGTDYLAVDNQISNPLKGGEIYWFPAKNMWLRQDEQVGKEKIYVVASRSRNQILEDLYAHLQKLRNEEAQGTVVSSAPTPTEIQTQMSAPIVPATPPGPEKPQTATPVGPQPAKLEQPTTILSYPAGSAKATQQEIEIYLEQTMGPTKAIIRKVRTDSQDPKIRTFDDLRRIMESSTLDAVRSISFLHKNR